MQCHPAAMSTSIATYEGGDDSEYDDNDYSSSLLPVGDEEGSDDKIVASKSWACHEGRVGEEGESVSIGNDRKRKVQPPNPAQQVRMRSIIYHRSSSASGNGGRHFVQPHDPSAGEHIDATAQQRETAEAPKGWTEAMHRQFVEAIYEIGVSHASPSVIMEHMRFMSTDEAQAWIDATSDYLSNNQVTSERVKSHLQKYRKNKKKSKAEFLLEYDRWMHKAFTVVGGISAAARTSLVTTPDAVLEMMGERAGDTKTTRNESSAKMLLGGDVAAFLTYSVMLEDEHAELMRHKGDVSMATNPLHSEHSASAAETSLLLLRHNWDLQQSSASQQNSFLTSAMEYSQGLSSGSVRIALPALTEEERQSSLGVSISHVVGLFHSMSHHLMKERKKIEQLTRGNYDAEGNDPEASGTSEQASTEDNSAESALVVVSPFPSWGGGMQASFSQLGDDYNHSRQEQVDYNSNSYRQEFRYQPGSQDPQNPPPV